MSSEKINRILSFLSETPDDCFLNHALALEYLKAGDTEQAAFRFRKNLSFDPAYVATYYHLGKLLADTGKTEDAIQIYETGMQKAAAAQDQHSLNELRSAYEDLIY